MSHLIRLFVLSLLTTLCFKISSFYPETINVQFAETKQEEGTSIPHAEVITQLLNFSEEPEDCTLPCFGEIRPDETTLPEIQKLSINLFDGDDSILAQFDKPFERKDGLQAYTLTSEIAKGYFDLSFIVSPQDKILRRFKASLFYPETWLEADILDIHSILISLGTPDEVYISLAASQPPQFSIAIGYKTLGTVILYTYKLEPEQLTQSDEPISLCGSWSNTYYIYAWIQNVDDKFYKALLNENLIVERENTEEMVYRAFWPLEKMTRWNVDDLIQFVSKNPEWCFDALSYDELLDAGYSY